MKRKFKFIVVSAVIASLAAAVVSVSANEAFEEETDITEAATEVTTEELTEQTTEAVAEESAEETNTSFKHIIIFEPGNVLTSWNGKGNYTETFNLTEFEHDFGFFISLSKDDDQIDGSNYTVMKNGNESITLTLSEEYLKSLDAGNHYFTVDFENVTLRGILAFNILETKSEVKNKLISDSVTGSPKTGTHGVGLVFSIITVSGTIAFITRKKYWYKMAGIEWIYRSVQGWWWFQYMDKDKDGFITEADYNWFAGYAS